MSEFGRNAGIQGAVDSTLAAALEALAHVAAADPGFALEVSHPDEPSLRLTLLGGATPSIRIRAVDPHPGRRVGPRGRSVAPAPDPSTPRPESSQWAKRP